jgi:hypothetical protein
VRSGQAVEVCVGIAERREELAGADLRADSHLE